MGAEDQTIDQRIKALIDREEIRDCLLRYTRGLDRSDLDLARSAYHDDARDDHQAYVGDGHGLVEWADGLHRESFESQQHYLTNIVIDLEGDTAHAETYYVVAGRKRDSFETFFGGGRYVDRLESRRGVWKIAARVCTMEWVMNPDEAAVSIPLSAPVSRGRDDLSWNRPLQVEREERIVFGPGSENQAHF